MFILRRILADDRLSRYLREGSYLPIGVALLLAIGSFFVFRNSVLNAGFPDTYHFRFLFRPLGYITNVWAEVLLVLLGWICLVRRYFTVFVFLCLLAILLSFSRGAYISLGIYLLSGFLWIKPLREKIRLLAIGFIVIALSACYFPQEMKTTLQMNRTVSQRQSTDGRMNAAQAAWNAFCERPFTGYGNGNFTYAIDHSMNQDSTRPYTSFAPNIIVQLLVEKGAFGTLLYGILALAVLCFIWKRRERPASRVIACVLLALLVKEMTQATLLCMPFASFMVYVLFAFLQKGEDEGEAEVGVKRLKNIFPVIALVCFILWNIPVLHTIDATPQLVNKALEYMNCYATNGELRLLNEAEKALEEASGRHPDDLQIIYLKARVYVAKKEMDKAELWLNRLVMASPKNSLYLVALSDVQYQRGKKKVALQSFINAVRFTPRLLTNERIRIWKQNDPLFYRELCDKLLTLQPLAEDSPSDYARYGYIARWCGSSHADEYLRQAITALPNLATPWHLLGDDRKYKLLLFGAFQKGTVPTEQPEEQGLTDERLFDRSYSAKFRNWYNGELILSVKPSDK